MLCPEKRDLIAEYAITMALYRYAMAKLEDSVAEGNWSAVADLNKLSFDAGRIASNARGDLVRHTLKHGR